MRLHTCLCYPKPAGPVPEVRLPLTHHCAMRTANGPIRQACCVAGKQEPGMRRSLPPLCDFAESSICCSPACSPNNNRTIALQHTTRKTMLPQLASQTRPRAPVLCSTKKPLPPSHVGHGACLNVRKAHSADVLLFTTTGEQTHASRSSHSPLLASLLDNRKPKPAPHPALPTPRSNATAAAARRTLPPLFQKAGPWHGTLTPSQGPGG